MFELLAQVDPLAAVMAGLWLFAAGMFPLGFLVGGCPCCGGDCELCTTGSLPETITVTINNVPSGAATNARFPPTLALAGNATATVSVTKSATEEVWGVSGVTVTAGGTGYTDGAAATFTLGTDDVQLTAAEATICVVHDAPENAVVTILDPDGIGPSTGAGAVLVPTWELLPANQWPAPHKKTYKLTGMTVTNGGSGYANYDIIEISFASADDGTVVEAAYVDADVVGTGGVIQQVYVANAADINTPSAAGKYIGSRTGALHSVQVTNGGEYYRAVVCTSDDDTYWNGMTVVLQRAVGTVYDSDTGLAACSYQHAVCGPNCRQRYLFGSFYLNEGTVPGMVEVFYSGPSHYPSVHLSFLLSGQGLRLTSTSYVTDCGQFSFTAEHESGATATVSAGGAYSASAYYSDTTGNCFACCRGEEPAPLEVAVEVEELDENGIPVPPIFMEEIPTVVLQKALGVCQSVWFGSLPNGYLVALEVTPCESCPDHCETIAHVRTIFGVGGSGALEQGYSDPGENCTNETMCGPVAGTYSVAKSRWNSQPLARPVLVTVP